jgi:hypothetical protein
MSEKIKLTPALERTILSYIRMGGYPHVAAAAAGVSDSAWRQWQEWGKKRNPYKEFFAKVEQAHATARVKAEIAVLENDPRFWLKHGSGKETPGKPGWSGMAKPTLTQGDPAVDVFACADFLRFMAILRLALAPYPDALMALSKALDQPTDASRAP